jgi:hypothetical protein
VRLNEIRGDLVEVSADAGPSFSRIAGKSRASSTDN